MCIHNALIKIISKDDLDIFIEIMNKYENQDFSNCGCNYENIKCLKLFSLYEAARSKAVGILNYILQLDLINKESCKYEALRWAVKYGYKENVELLLKHDTNTTGNNNDNITVLYMAILKKFAEIVELLLKYKADPNESYLYETSPLFFAVDIGNKDIVELLLKYKADPNKEDKYNETPLHSAVRRNDRIISELLLNYKADPNKENNYNETPLHLAVKTNDKIIVELLLKYKADPNKENKYNETPLHIAADKGNEEIFNILYQVTDQKYKNDIPILQYIKFLKIEKLLKISTKTQSVFILQSYEFDDTSLLSRDYICSDLVFLILKQLKKEKRLLKYEKMIEN